MGTKETRQRNGAVNNRVGRSIDWNMDNNIVEHFTRFPVESPLRGLLVSAVAGEASLIYLIFLSISDLSGLVSLI